MNGKEIVLAAAVIVSMTVSGGIVGVLHDMPPVLERIAKCRAFRLSCKRAATRKLAASPTLFDQTRNPKTAIVIPKVSSERREYIPIGFIDDSVIVTDLAFLVPDATLYHFGILTSRLHNAWMRAVAGRLKSDYRHSKDIVVQQLHLPGRRKIPHNKSTVDLLCGNRMFRAGDP